MDTQTKLENAEIKRRAIFDDIESLRSNEAEADKLIAELKAKLAEEAKPKLRHGDYGFDRQKHLTMVVAMNKGLKLVRCSMSKGGGLQNMDCDYTDDSIVDVIGNFPDDLKALQEDVTGFEISNSCFYEIKGVLTDGTVQFKQDNSVVVLAVRELPKLIKKLRQMEMTLKRKAIK